MPQGEQGIRLRALNDKRQSIKKTVRVNLFKSNVKIKGQKKISLNEIIFTWSGYVLVKNCGK